ncbi:acyltransferase family protein [Tuwongella immobilis]|uniref:DUF5009 domain-containing protein n=1 Tax=Tuwongella immobilis TaxID=692036 RepID=A0A6C2YJN4_9BACT|nr:hypothetical protein [Tuwongella immobilis]VIP01587.1 Uncharacterized protein OS=Runella slithyformis (strain ATCC 29530 / DSM 19594 / LMG 11500 / NCIMB 11436 / LSU 4) GN=Runsl_2127 PE=4 SV=1 [Tuwongella immobilis]VTR98851.1 Uncharacterized protein OS=Runella slithyformis (strain ATCC 29530 / DSM 19594 / LMG 11500 / NCIMB 11436 / LSU 4) GN=Runsl_2127 PE=4 SV=1 [Tuwongella immobilis]
MTPPQPTPPKRILSIDAYRGFVMFLMMAEILHLSGLTELYPTSTVMKWIQHHTSHVAWTGCSLHDLIQPSFSFLVGVALPFSLASRLTKGQSIQTLFVHALLRSLILIFLGIGLRSLGKSQINWTFEDTLTQIGLGYPFLFLIALTTLRVQIISLVTILVGYWFAFVLFPTPGPEFPYESVGVNRNGLYTWDGFQSHWNMNSNFAWWVDTHFLNWFPRESRFEFNRGGYSTLSFIPTLGTMILGLFAGNRLRSASSPSHEPTQSSTLRQFITIGVLLLIAGYGIHGCGICPSVKKIWTPSWVLFSGGWCFLMLAGFEWLTQRSQSFGIPTFFIVIGRNSIFIYCLVHIADRYLLQWNRWLIQSILPVDLTAAWLTVIAGVFALAIYWGLLWIMNRKRWYIKI